MSAVPPEGLEILRISRHRLTWMKPRRTDTQLQSDLHGQLSKGTHFWSAHSGWMDVNSLLLCSIRATVSLHHNTAKQLKALSQNRWVKRMEETNKQRALGLKTQTPTPQVCVFTSAPVHGVSIQQRALRALMFRSLTGSTHKTGQWRHDFTSPQSRPSTWLTASVRRLCWPTLTQQCDVDDTKTVATPDKGDVSRFKL